MWQGRGDPVEKFLRNTGILGDKYDTCRECLEEKTNFRRAEGRNKAANYLERYKEKLTKYRVIET